MQNTDTDRTEETGEEPSESTPNEVKRGGDRRSDGVRLFAYNGPERRSDHPPL